MTPVECAAALGRTCSVPDDGRWYRRETVHGGMLVSGMMRKRGVSPNEYTDLCAVKYEPRIFERTMTDNIRIKDRIS